MKNKNLQYINNEIQELKKLVWDLEKNNTDTNKEEILEISRKLDRILTSYIKISKQK
ncbi:MAG: hypothetical protein JG777_420 [Clostridia bacterium]|jgi:ribosomal protein S2|nr:hypothetical protein [Clostridia bacterium]